MPEFRFLVDGVHALDHAVAPTLALGIRVVNATPEPVHSLLLRCQVQLEPARRRYTPEEQLALHDLFSTPERWDRTLQPLLWHQGALFVHGFTGTALAEFHLPCSFDHELAVTRYCQALDNGHIPIRLCFSGTAFIAADDAVQAVPIPWELDAAARIPVELWRACIQAHYPDTAILRLSGAVHRRLLAYRSTLGLPNWDRTIDNLLAASNTVRTRAREAVRNTK